MIDEFPLIETCPENTSYYGTNNIVRPMNSLFNNVTSNDAVAISKELVEVRKYEIDARRRMNEIKCYTDISHGQSNIVCNWLQKRGIGEKTIDVETRLEEGSVGLFRGSSRTFSVKTKVKIG